MPHCLGRQKRKGPRCGDPKDFTDAVARGGYAVRVGADAVDGQTGLHMLLGSGVVGSQLRPIQHPPGCRGGHSDRNCVRFSTHQGVRKPVFDVPKKMTHTTNACFPGFCRPKILGRQKSEPRGNHFCVLLGFRRSRGNKKQQTRAATAPMPSAAGIF